MHDPIANDKKYSNLKEKGPENCTREELIWMVEYLQEEVFQTACNGMGDDN